MKVIWTVSRPRQCDREVCSSVKREFACANSVLRRSSCKIALKRYFAVFNRYWTLVSQSRRRRVYHQHEVLYIIIAKKKCTRMRDEIQPQRGWWYAPHFARWWYTIASQWIKKSKSYDLDFLVRQMGLEPIRLRHTPLKRACLPIPALPHI